MIKELLFTFYVFGNYTKYIPFCVYGIFKSYPNSHIKIFVDGKLKENEKESLKLFNTDNLEIKENYKLLNEIKGNMKGGNLRIARFIIPYEEFKDFQYVYVGDIDMLIYKENPSLLESHIEHMKKIGLPFSNGIRKNSTRLTGLHFFETQPYFNKMNNIIERCLSDEEYLYNLTKDCERDENFLYKIVEIGIGIGNIKNKITQDGELYYRPHHGVHLGLFRGNNNNNENWERVKYILDYFGDDTFNKIIELVNITEIVKLKKYDKNNNLL